MEINIKQIIDLVLRRWWLFVVFAIIAGLASFYMNFFVFVPVYEASTTIFVNNKDQNSNEYGIAYDQLMVNMVLIADYAELINSRSICEAVIEDLKLENYSAEMLSSMISVSSVNDTHLMQISVLDPDPELAMNVANSVAKVFSEKAVELMNIPNVNIIDRAVLPEYPVAPTKMRNIAAAVFAAIALAAGVVFGIEFRDNTIKSEDDVEKRLGLTVLGTIPDLNIK